MAESGLEFPVKEIQWVAVACRPDEPLPAGDERYADFTGLRCGIGARLIWDDMQQRLPPGQFYHRCLCGHRGSGKSTELLRLVEWANAAGYLAIPLTVDAHYGGASLEFSDLFLLAAASVEEAMKEIRHPLPAARLRHLERWFADVVREQKTTTQAELGAEAGAELGGGLPLGLGKLFARFSARLKAGSEEVVTARRHLRNYPDVLVDMTNDLLTCANGLLAEAGRPKGLLLLFDNLDRYEPECIYKVLFQSGTLVAQMACHALFTIPIALEYDPPGPIHDEFGTSFVLPMLALRGPDQTWGATGSESSYDKGAVDAVAGALRQRVDLDALFEEPANVRLLAGMSGGCVRDLMHLVTLAVTFSGGAGQVTRAAVQRAIRELRATYVRRLTDEDYERLAKIARREEVPRDKLTRRLLFNRFALEYRDANAEPWMDIHPLVLDTKGFQNAYARGSTVVRG